MSLGAPTRRGFASLLLGGVASSLAWKQSRAAPRDQGIGGTGAAPESPPQGETSDRGIGGTGVVGTIRKFGSIYVNDLRIAYATNVAVRIDGVAASAKDLRIGQVVRVVATRSGADYATTAIEVSSEAAGPIERVDKTTLRVAGQSVDLSEIPNHDAKWKIGNVVSIYGLRRPDGTIVASLVSPRSGGPVRVAGPVTLGSSGAPMIGGLILRGADRSLIGASAVVTGAIQGDALQVHSQIAETTILSRAGAREFLIEAYARRQDGGLRLGSGLVLSGAAEHAPSEGFVRAVVRAELGPQGGLALRSFRTVPGFGGLGSGERRPGGRGGPGGHGGPGAHGGIEGGRGERFGRRFFERPPGGVQHRFGDAPGGERGHGGFFGGRRGRGPFGRRGMETAPGSGFAPGDFGGGGHGSGGGGGPGGGGLGGGGLGGGGLGGGGFGGGGFGGGGGGGPFRR